MDYEWKPGQTVAFYSNHARVPDRRTIDRVTPSGRAGIMAMQFHKNGNLVGRGTWSSCRVEPWSDETEARVAEHNRRIAARLVADFIKGGIRDYATPAEIIEAVRAVLAAKATESPGASSA